MRPDVQAALTAIGRRDVTHDRLPVDLKGAYLFRADLSGADLSRANLTGADFTGADFTGAFLAGANLTRANLAGANLTRAHLLRANFTDSQFAAEAVVPRGWRRDPDSGRLKHVGTNPGGATAT
jgi:uncharacterized protein YjbI with pentapeptide repeats